MYVFKVPSLRNVAMTPPYFHDGSVRSLPRAVHIMAKVQLGKNLSDQDVGEIVTFLESLTGKLPEDFARAPVLPAAEFRDWFRAYLPQVARGEPKNLLEPAKVTDRSDPQLVHLDGLNLSRAWCMKNIAAALPKDDPSHKVLAESAARHAEVGLKHVASGDYAGEHWLASFAVYLLSVSAE